MLERQDVTVNDKAFIIDPHRTLSVSGDVVNTSVVAKATLITVVVHHGN